MKTMLERDSAASDVAAIGSQSDADVTEPEEDHGGLGGKWD